MASERDDLKHRLRAMDDEITAMIASADDWQEHLLSALLCDVHDCVVRRYAEIVAD